MHDRILNILTMVDSMSNAFEKSMKVIMALRLNSLASSIILLSASIWLMVVSAFPESILGNPEFAVNFRSYFV